MNAGLCPTGFVATSRGPIRLGDLTPKDSCVVYMGAGVVGYASAIRLSGGSVAGKRVVDLTFEPPYHIAPVTLTLDVELCTLPDSRLKGVYAKAYSLVSGSRVTSLNLATTGGITSTLVAGVSNKNYYNMRGEYEIVWPEFRLGCPFFYNGILIRGSK